MIALVVALTAVWTLRDWANLSQLRLPDTDDAVRLQQIRDWLAGQRFADLTQYRLGGGGVAMHWSRLADLAPGGLIVMLTPVIGRHAAEVAAVIAWPAILFAAALFLIARIARVMLVPAWLAVVVGALAFPATAMFVPGRIDHHGLQLALLLVVVTAMLAPRGTVSGAAIALAGVASLVVGIETAPFLLLAGILVVLGWIAGRDGAEPQMRALGLALAGGLVVARLIFGTTSFAYPACDGFTLPVWLAGLSGSAAVLALVVAGRYATTRRARLGAAAVAGVLAGAAVLWFAPSCLSPYGGVDPALATRWLAKVGEAQPLFAASPATVLAQCGLMVAGLVAGAIAFHRTRDPGWAILWLFQAMAAALTVWQVRGANAGALLGVPALAWGLAAARERGVLATVAAWLACAGITYPLAARLLPEPATPAPPMCDDPATLAALDTLPRGRIAGPVDLGAWGAAATSHGYLAAPYHRNNAGNRAAFAIIDGPRDRALAFADAWRVDYVAACGPAPGWLADDAPVLRSGSLSVYRIHGLPRAGEAP